MASANKARKRTMWNWELPRDLGLFITLFLGAPGLFCIVFAMLLFVSHPPIYGVISIVIGMIFIAAVGVVVSKKRID
jgi:hypothetical protein